ncbi:P-loop containing nucleoside triphosphate hydrolase protein [Athelia psychrophila]|uniref:P-loop containing nucleoside triphosphate hydrolase protein n=1 Tax=Athelia psychrophila TaxID=1759441 RepID=A0A166PE00_9AGAM|nr:P-loop containing nucleoside triphosphate hydrolase protein [Fibularhizoctonia sp. CBS 109695]
MDAAAAECASYLVEKLKSTPSSTRLLVGITGIPASGKSTFAERVVSNTNHALSAEGKPDPTILVGLDGWHLTRAQLDAFPSPQVAHARRGAHWTFDGPSYVEFIRSLRKPLSPDEVITAPSFDHALKDPEPHAVSIYAYHRIVVIEGLYTFLSIDPWLHGGEELDERWIVDVAEGEALERLVKRHVKTGVCKDLQEAEHRAEENDMPNGRFILKNLLQPTKRIPSVEDPVLTQSL